LRVDHFIAESRRATAKRQMTKIRSLVHQLFEDSGRPLMTRVGPDLPLLFCTATMLRAALTRIARPAPALRTSMCAARFAVASRPQCAFFHAGTTPSFTPTSNITKHFRNITCSSMLPPNSLCTALESGQRARCAPSPPRHRRRSPRSPSRRSSRTCNCCTRDLPQVCHQLSA
jgi:hypothetical protein